MKRTIEQWRDCSPRIMAQQMSRAAIQYALEDAKADILELHAEIERLTDVLRTLHTVAECGVCCCGDSMESHHPYTTDHAPRDQVEYTISKALGNE